MSGFGYSDWSYDPFEKMVIFPPDPLLLLPPTSELRELTSQLLPMQLTPFLILSHSSLSELCGIGSKSKVKALLEPESPNLGVIT